MIYYSVLIIGCSIYFILLSKLYIMTNEGCSTRWIIFYMFFRSLPILVVIAKLSRSPVFDAMLYDILMLIICAIAMALFSKKGFESFTVGQYVFFFLMLLSCLGYKYCEIKGL